MAKEWCRENALDKLTVIRTHAYFLHQNAIQHIKEEDAIEVRDMTEDIICKIDVWAQKHVKNWASQNMGVV